MTAALLTPAAGEGAASAAQTYIAHWGSLGEGTGASADTLLSPTQIDLPGQVVQVATSNSTQYALLASGAVYAWGLGGDGQLGYGGTGNSFTVAVQVRFPVGVTIAALPTDAMPFSTGLALDTKGNVWGWGLNMSGELCLGNTARYLSPVELPLTGVTILAGAGDHALYDSNGTVYGCGGNGHGDLGDGTKHLSRTPVPVQGLAGRHVQALVASFNDSGALLDNGEYLDWGYDGQGQLGDGELGVSSTVPVEVSLPLPVTQVAQGGSDAGNGQTLVILSNGSLRSWGDGQSGQLGDEQTGIQPSPVEFFPPNGVTYEQLATSGVTSYALSSTGDVYSFGGGRYGQIGNGKTANRMTPVLVESGVSLLSATARGVATG